MSQYSNWPDVTFEERPWVRSGDELTTRRQLRRIRSTYQASVPPFIARQPVILTSEALAAADEASHALARFDARVGDIVAPFAEILLRTESASSSEVENLTASAKQVALALSGDSRSANARLVVANVRAMNAALALGEELDENAVLAMHDALLRESAPQFVVAWRAEQVWIGGGAWSPHEAVFVPPHHDRIPALMSDLLEFAARDDVPILAQAAIAHAQFETIQPFPDGNGRTGRALIQALLRRGGLTRTVTVPVSAGLLRDTPAYFTALQNYRAGDVDAIVHALAYASFAAIANGGRLVADLQATRSSWNDRITARSDSSAYRVVDLLLAQPVVTAKAIREQLRISEPAAHHAIDTLISAGILTKAAGSERYRIWQAAEVIDALDAFAERARRGR